MAYQRGSTRERVSLAERFKGLLRRTVLMKGAGNIAYGIGRGLGLGTLSSFAIGQATGLALLALQDRSGRRTTTKKRTRTQGAAKRRNSTGTIRKAAKRAVKKGVSAARARFIAATRRAVKEGLRVGTKEFGRRMKELLA